MRLRNLIMMAAAIFPLAALAADDWAQLGKYDQANKQILESGNYPVVVFMGNSITQGWPDAHPYFFTDNNFAGRGISGQTTYQFLVRFREDVIDIHPKAVVINGGTNDIAENNYAYNEDHTFGNIVSMAELADINGIKVILTPVLPSVQFPWRKEIKDIPEKQKKLNARIKEYAQSKGFGFADYYTPMVTETGALNPEYSNDGVHPNAAGYEIMESVVFPVITKTLSGN